MGGEQPIRILIADDDDSIRKSMAAILLLNGYEVETVGDGRQAIEAARASRFDIIFVDYKMPGMSGVDASAELVKLSPDSVVALMTAYSTDNMKNDVLRQGVYALYIKPFDVEDAVKSILERELSSAT